jgi:hypothetical protein
MTDDLRRAVARISTAMRRDADRGYALQPRLVRSWADRLRAELEARCSTELHPGFSPRGFQCTLNEGHSGQHVYDTSEAKL